MNALDQIVQVALGDDYHLLCSLGIIKVEPQINKSYTIDHPPNSIEWMVNILEKT